MEEIEASREDDGSVQASSGPHTTECGSSQVASSGGSNRVASGGSNGGEDTPQSEAKAELEPPPSTTTRELLQRLRMRQALRDKEAWDVEDSELEAARLDHVGVHINSCLSGTTDESSSAATKISCPIQRSPSSLDFESQLALPYFAQYRREVEEEEDAEMQQLLRQLKEEEQAARDLAVAHRYQLMQEQLVMIQKQLGHDSSKVPDLDWLLANEPEFDNELEEVVAAFAARDDDLPREVSEGPEVPLTCRNLFCRCPCRRQMRKDERASVPSHPTVQ